MASKTISKVEITLPPLHPGQIEIANSNTRFKVVLCGRRWGKTVLGVYLCIRGAIDGERWWWVAPNYKIANEGWTNLKWLARQIPQAEIRESDRQIILPNGGMVEVRSSDVEGSLRGAGLDGVVIDEAGYHRESVWVDELRHALIDKRGDALFIGTPNGNNWFAQLYKRATSGQFPSWAGWHHSTWDNPYISNEERIEIEAEYVGQQERYLQEIEANIGASQYLVYPTFDRTAHMWRWELPHFKGFYGALDFAGDTIGAHKSAGVLVGLTQQEILLILGEFEESGPNIAERQFEWVGKQEQLTKELVQNKYSTSSNIYWKGDKSERLGLQFARSFGLSISPTKGGPDSISHGIHLVQNRLAVRGDGKARLYYLPQLKKIPEAFERYRYPEPKETSTSVKINPIPVNDDLITTVRYAVEAADQGVIGDPAQLYKGLIPTIG